LLVHPDHFVHLVRHEWMDIMDMMNPMDRAALDLLSNNQRPI